jgi:hypothetical protein
MPAVAVCKRQASADGPHLCSSPSQRTLRLQPACTQPASAALQHSRAQPHGQCRCAQPHSTLLRPPTGVSIDTLTTAVRRARHIAQRFGGRTYTLCAHARQYPPWPQGIITWSPISSQQIMHERSPQSPSSGSPPMPRPPSVPGACAAPAPAPRLIATSPTCSAALECALGAAAPRGLGPACTMPRQLQAACARKELRLRMRAEAGAAPACRVPGVGRCAGAAAAPSVAVRAAGSASAPIASPASPLAFFGFVLHRLTSMRYSTCGLDTPAIISDACTHRAHLDARAARGERGLRAFSAWRCAARAAGAPTGGPFSRSPPARARRLGAQQWPSRCAGTPPPSRRGPARSAAPSPPPARPGRGTR